MGTLKKNIHNSRERHNRWDCISYENASFIIPTRNRDLIHFSKHFIISGVIFLIVINYFIFFVKEKLFLSWIVGLVSESDCPTVRSDSLIHVRQFRTVDKSDKFTSFHYDEGTDVVWFDLFLVYNAQNACKLQPDQIRLRLCLHHNEIMWICPLSDCPKLSDRPTDLYRFVRLSGPTPKMELDTSPNE